MIPTTNGTSTTINVVVFNMTTPLRTTLFSCALIGLLQCISIDSFAPPLTFCSTKTTTPRHVVVVVNPNQQQFSSRCHMTSQPDDEVSSTRKTTTLGFSQEVLDEAKGALNSVGWAPPKDDGALTSDDPFVRNINAGILRDVGVELDDLLNPAKVVNLERELYVLRRDLARATGKSINEATELSTDDCDGGGGGEEADTIRTAIVKKESDLFVERRSVFRGWLKTVFVAQAFISFGVSYIMATNPSSLFGGNDWFYYYNMDVSIRVLGYWFWWLFVVPSLRSRRPTGAEKKALDIAFLGTPLISILAPIATKDTGIIWFANFLVVAGSYGFAFLLDSDDGGDDKESSQPAWLRFIYKSLDFGSGRERGARK